MTYAGFWRRLGAGIIDFSIWIPLWVIQGRLSSYSKTLAIVLSAATCLVYAAYQIYFHSRWGQTLGKMALGIRVMKLSGESIGVREAVIRSSVDLILTMFWIVGITIAYLNLPDSEFYQMDWVERNIKLNELAPSWMSWQEYLSNGWYWSEVVVILFNEKKRALHDFLAGTVVIVLNPRKRKMTSKDLELEALREFKGFSNND
jgi:uncharacterized RDD family membrane protein YckC